MERLRSDRLMALMIGEEREEKKTKGGGGRTGVGKTDRQKSIVKAGQLHITYPAGG